MVSFHFLADRVTDKFQVDDSRNIRVFVYGRILIVGSCRIGAGQLLETCRGIMEPRTGSLGPKAPRTRVFDRAER